MNNRNNQLNQEIRELADHLFPDEEFEAIFRREANLNMCSIKRKLLAHARRISEPGTNIPISFVNQIVEKATELAIQPFNQRVDDLSKTLDCTISTLNVLRYNIMRERGPNEPVEHYEETQRMLGSRICDVLVSKLTAKQESVRRLQRRSNQINHSPTAP